MAGDKILVIVSSSDKGKAFTGLLWASRLKEKGLVSDVKVYLFGPAEKLVADGDEELRSMIRKLLGLGVEVLACHGVAEMGGYEGKLKEFMGEERVTHVGRLIVERIREGYVPLVF